MNLLLVALRSSTQIQLLNLKKFLPRELPGPLADLQPLVQTETSWFLRCSASRKLSPFSTFALPLRLIETVSPLPPPRRLFDSSPREAERHLRKAIRSQSDAEKVKQCFDDTAPEPTWGLLVCPT